MWFSEGFRGRGLNGVILYNVRVCGVGIRETCVENLTGSFKVHTLFDFYGDYFFFHFIYWALLGEGVMTVDGLGVD